MNHINSIKTDYHIYKEKKIFYRYRPGSSNIYISFLHGYPTSSLDYVQVFESIPLEFHVVAHDFLGFGHSDKPIKSQYLLTEQADLTNDLFLSLGIEKLHIVAHDYGTSVATEMIARYNTNSLEYTIKSVTLSNGSMLINLSKLRLIQKLLKNKWTGNLIARLSSEKTFQRNMQNIWYDKTRYDTEKMKEHWELLISRNGRKVLPKITRYIDQRYTNYERWIGALAQSKLPIHILWAENDPVAIVAMAYRLDEIIKNSCLTIMKECGHYPMMEKEEEWIINVLSFIRNLK